MIKDLSLYGGDKQKIEIKITNIYVNQEKKGNN